MRSDLDQLMLEREINALIIPANEGENPYRDYITGGIKAHAMVIKKQGAAPVIIANSMEVDEAKKSGLQVVTHDDLKYTEIIKEHGRGTPATRKAYWTKLFDHFGIQGNLALYGIQDIQSTLGLSRFIENDLSDRVVLVQDQTPDIFSLASETKDKEELTKLKNVGKRTSAVMRKTREWLADLRHMDGKIVNNQSKEVTIGDVKRFVRLKLLEFDLEDVGASMIFAQGRDAGVPHSRGEDDHVLKAGEAIVFDLFPRQIGGGYFHDMTRTWCLGHAPDHIKQDFDLVLNIFHRSLENITLGEPTKNVDTQVCEWFESAGHPTRKSTPNITEGYVHSLGHGIGLNIHESPGISQLGSDKTIFKAGQVVTIEPGLYYPSKGYGIRIEDAIYLDEDGQLHNLTDCPYDLVIELKS